MNKDLFVSNRKKIFDEMEDESILIAFSREEINDIVKQKYNVDRNYFYLCGVFEFENTVVLIKTKNVTSEMIYINPYDEKKALWFGAPKSKEEITEISGLTNVRYQDIFDNNIYDMLSRVTTLYLDLPHNSIKATLTENELFAKVVKEKCPWIQVKNSRKLFEQARTIKSSEEIAEIRKAIEITNKGLENILANIKPMYEYQLESYFDQAIKFNGATGYAFPTIAASGKNGCCLHYSDNDCYAKDGDLILFDLGASVNMYCSDISRTYPVNGKFTERQKQIYNIVLNGQKKVFEAAKPGLTTRDLNNVLKEYFAIELKKIGLIKEDSEVLKYYYHGVSHHLGLDCHDLCDYGPLKPGCIISNEPGLYIAEENIGIRIEDDILITETGAEWLSPQIIKEPDEIENYIALKKE